MSTHPNAILLLALTPDNLTRKTYRAILEEAGIHEDDKLKIADDGYFVEVMEGDYNEGFQISAKEGDIVIFDHVTYGYGDVIKWEELEQKKKVLEEWAKVTCEKHSCTHKFFVTANYW